MMDSDWDFVKVFLIPGVGLSLGLFLLVCCCKQLRCFKSDQSPVASQNSVYVIPLPVSGERNSDVDLEEAYAPPSYDNIDPPPPYSERKFSIPDEEPPAYSEIS